MCKIAAVKSVKQKTRETKEEEAEEVYVTQINLELTSENKKYGRLTQKIKLKKNNIYLMHFVQPVTAMFPGLVSSSLRPNQTSCESKRSLLPRITVTAGGRGLSLFGQLGWKDSYSKLLLYNQE